MTIEYTDESQQVAIVSISRNKKMNALSFNTFVMIREVFEYLGRIGSPVRAIVFTGKGKHFTAGIDLFEVPQDLQSLLAKADETDPGRAAIEFLPAVKILADCVSSIENVRVPVIAAINGYCLGAGNDFISACDIRLCTKNAKFSIKEVELGLASDF